MRPQTVVVSLALFLATSLLPKTELSAQTFDTWVGGSEASWFTPTNWSTGAVPDATTNVMINSGVAEIDDASAMASSVLLGYFPSTNGGIFSSGGTLNLGTQAGNVLDVGYGGTGSMELQLGAVVTDNTGAIGLASGATGFVRVYSPGTQWINSYQLNVGTSGNGTLQIVGGGLATAPYVSIGFENGGQGAVTVDGQGSSLVSSSALSVGRVGSGTLNVTSGGSVSSSYGVEIAEDPGAVGSVTVDGIGSKLTAANIDVGTNGTGTVTVSNGGTLNANSNSYSLDIGRFPGSNGTVNVNGGVVHAVDTLVGGIGTGTLTISNGGVFNGGVSIGFYGVGTVTVDGANSRLNADGVGIGYEGTGTLNIINGGTVDTPACQVATNGGTGTVNLDGGTLKTDYVNTGYYQSAGTSTFNFNGGTLQASANDGVFVDNAGLSFFFHGMTTANVRNGGAVIDTNGYTDTIASPLTHSNITGDNATDGGLTKLGAGSLILSAANTYTGATNVNAGTLTINGSIVSSTYVNNGATLGGNGTIGGGVAIHSGGTLAPANAGTGKLAIAGDLTLESGGRFVFQLGPVGYDQVTYGATLTLAGNLIVNLAGPTPQVGNKFYIIDGTGFSAAVGAFINATSGNLITDNVGNTYLINYTDHDPGDASNLFPNDLSLTVISIVPEPSTWALLAIGFAAILITLARRDSARASRTNEQG